MYELFERAKPDDTDLLSEIQSIPPFTLMGPGRKACARSLLASKVVDWLQASHHVD